MKTTKPKLHWLYDPERRVWRCTATVWLRGIRSMATEDMHDAEPGFDQRAVEQDCLAALLRLTERI